MPEPEVISAPTVPAPSTTPSSSELADKAVATVAETGQTPATTETKPEPAVTPDPWDTVKDNPEVLRRIEAEAQRRADQLAQKRLAKARMENGRTAVKNEDPDAAIRVLREMVSEPDEDEARDAGWQAKADKAQPILDDLLDVDGTGQATNPHYIELYKREGREKMDALWDKDPVAFIKWAKAETFKIAIAAEVKRVAPGLYQAGVTDATNKALQALPTPPSGGSGGAGESEKDFIQSYSEGKSDDHARWRKIASRLT